MVVPWMKCSELFLFRDIGTQEPSHLVQWQSSSFSCIAQQYLLAARYTIPHLTLFSYFSGIQTSGPHSKLSWTCSLKHHAVIILEFLWVKNMTQLASSLLKPLQDWGQVSVESILWKVWKERDTQAHSTPLAVRILFLIVVGLKAQASGWC